MKKIFAILVICLLSSPAFAVDMYLTPKLALGLGSTQTDGTTAYETESGLGYGLDLGWELNDAHTQAMELTVAFVSSNTTATTTAGVTQTGKVGFSSMGGAYVYKQQLGKLLGRLKLGYGHYTQVTRIGDALKTDTGMALISGVGANYQGRLLGSEVDYLLELEASGFAPKTGASLYLGVYWGF